MWFFLRHLNANLAIISPSPPPSPRTDRPGPLVAAALGIADAAPPADAADVFATWGPGDEFEALKAAVAAGGTPPPPFPPVLAPVRPVGGAGADGADPEAEIAAMVDLAVPAGATGQQVVDAARGPPPPPLPESWRAAAEAAPCAPLLAAASGGGGAAALEAAVAAALARRPRVWVLMGGDGAGRHRALAAGASALRKLRRFPDVQAEAFLLAPGDAGAGEAARRAALLRRATEYTVIGIPEADWPEAMRGGALKHMAPLALPAAQRLVWALQEPQLQRPGVESALCAAEAAQALAGVSYWGAPVEQRHRKEALVEVQRELAALGVEVRKGGLDLVVLEEGGRAGRKVS